MRSPRWMVAYGIGLVLLAGLYVSVVYIGPGAALVFGVFAFVAMLVAVGFAAFG